MEHTNEETKAASPFKVLAEKTEEVPQDRVISLDDAMEHLKKPSLKEQRKQEKQAKMQRDYLNSMVSRGEVMTSMQELGTNFDKAMLQYHEQSVVPLYQANRATANMYEVLIEALIRKGVISVDFIKEVQEELIKAALERQKAEQAAAETEANGYDNAITTTEEEETNEQQSNHEDSREV